MLRGKHERMDPIVLCPEKSVFFLERKALNGKRLWRAVAGEKRGREIT